MILSKKLSPDKFETFFNFFDLGSVPFSSTDFIIEIDLETLVKCADKSFYKNVLSGNLKEIEDLQYIDHGNDFYYYKFSPNYAKAFGKGKWESFQFDFGDIDILFENWIII